VCHYEAANDWWISKMIKKHKSTVLSLAWCINNKFVVTGGCDFKCRIFSAYMAGIDTAEDDGFGEIWPKQHNFGEILAEFDHAQSWVQSVAWSPSGFRIAFAEHASKIHFVQILAGSPPMINTQNHKGLPFVSTCFLSDNTVAAVGFDNNPALFKVVGGSDAEPVWGFQEQFEKTDKKAEVKGAAGSAAPAVKSPVGTGAVGRGGAFEKARGLFANATDKGQTLQTTSKAADAKAGASVSASAAITTRHSNCITTLWPVQDEEGKTIGVYTSALDGRVLYWDLVKLGISVK